MLVSCSILLLMQSGPKIVGEVVRIASNISSCRGGGGDVVVAVLAVK